MTEEHNRVFVGFILSWIAAVIYMTALVFLVPLAASVLVSLTVFTVTFCFSNFVDQLHWPSKD